MSLPFRQIHLDFHTSEHITGIASAWDRRHWQETLQRARVNSINIFAVCHHGWSYYNTQVGERHPHLPPGFDLTRAQLEACLEVGIRVQIYCTVGVNNRVARRHPEWRAINEQGTYYGWSQRPTDPGFHMLCFNTPYLDFVCEQIRELGRLFPEADGLWLDIIHKPHCFCPWCLESMVREGFDPKNSQDVALHADRVLQRFYQRSKQALRDVHPTMRLTQNSGHLTRGDRRFFDHVTHLELESLPTGGWGYDHFPINAKYAQTTGLEYLGMTGKFHTVWGEFGGYKHPNALRYECAAMLAYGAKCSVGDQLHPDGRLDESTYTLIGQAYAEVEAKEPWCEGARNVADIALLSAVALDPRHERGEESDTGATRLLLEGHLLFDILDGETDLAPYRMVIVPDDAVIAPPLQRRLETYLAGGGQIFFVGRSPIGPDGQLLFDLGAEVAGESPFSVDFILPLPELRPSFVQSPMVIYDRYPRLRVSDGHSLGEIYEPWFERAWNHFCSHQHAPPRRTPSGYACGVEKGGCLWLPMAAFRLYRQGGQVALKDFLLACLRRRLGGAETVRTTLPSTARLTLTRQDKPGRYVLHLLAPTLVHRGGVREGHRGGPALEVIEDLIPCCDVEVSVRLPAPVRRVVLQPQGRPLPFTQTPGGISFRVDRFTCHQMIEIA